MRLFAVEEWTEVDPSQPLKRSLVIFENNEDKYRLTNLTTGKPHVFRGRAPENLFIANNKVHVT